MNGLLTAGYASATYAGAQHHIGEPVCIGGAWFVRRTAPGGRTDLMAPYPLLRCHDWSALDAGLASQLEDVAVCGVTDPFCDPGPEILAEVFPDLVRPWKEHHIVRLTDDTPPSSHHRRNLRKVEVDTRRVSAPSSAADDLVRLYRMLRERHAVVGPADFPATSLDQQLRVDGTAVWVAEAADEVVAIVVAYTEGPYGWYHLGAASEEGYRRRAMFGLFDTMIRDLRTEGIEVLDLGAGAGTDTASVGLDRFKRGWAPGSSPTHLVGRILDRPAYDELTGTSTAGHSWFPAYRSGLE